MCSSRCSYDVRGRSFTKALFWSDSGSFGPRAYFVTVSRPAALTVDNVQLDDGGVSTSLSTWALSHPSTVSLPIPAGVSVSSWFSEFPDTESSDQFDSYWWVFNFIRANKHAARTCTPNSPIGNLIALADYTLSVRPTRLHARRRVQSRPARLAAH